MNKFCNEVDDFGLEIIQKNAFPSMSKNWNVPLKIYGKTVTTKKESEESYALNLYDSVDGKGLKHEMYTSVVNR